MSDVSQIIQATAPGGPLHPLTQYRQFLAYRLVPDPKRAGKTQKKPVSVHTGQTCDHTDPANWCSRDEALAYVEAGHADGVGFEFTESDEFWFLDIDNGLQGGQWLPLPQSLFNLLAGVALEISSGRNGAHAFGSGPVPPHSCKNTALGLEFYTSGRFVALTGIGCSGSAAWRNDAAVAQLVAEYFPPGAASTGLAEWTDEPCAEWNGHKDDGELLRHGYRSTSAAGAFTNRATLAALFEGDAEALAVAYPDDSGTRPYDASSADAALAQHLAFWTGKDCERIRRLMLLSGLKRDKWDRADYLPRTILAACNRCTAVHQRKMSAPVQVEAHSDEHPDLSHDGLALKANNYRQFSELSRYVPQWGAWMFYSEGVWQKDLKLQALTKFREFLRHEAHGLMTYAEQHAQNLPENEANRVMKWAREQTKLLRQAPTVNSVESMARSNPEVSATPEQFDADPMLLGTPGGAVDLRTGETLPASPDHKLTKRCAVKPAPAGTGAPLWRAFLDRVLGPEVAAFMQRAAGYALTGQTSEHKLFFLYGTGRNGKSVFLNTLFDIYSDYSKRAPAQTFLDSSGERHPTDLAGLMGARLVGGSELPPGKAWNESVIKDLTGGDVITARFMRQDFFEYKPQFTLFIAGNHQPSFRGIDEAIRARVVLVPFTQTIPAEERDPELPEKLKAEWPAILRWAIDGALMWQRDGLQVPDAVKGASEDYLADEDTVGAFLDEHVGFVPDARETTADVYQRFRHWQIQSGVSNPWTQTAVTRALKERGIQTAKLTGGARGFRGIQLKSPFLKASGT
tara:strand:- start:3745 stop:6135 length:2391 start_codon:yes stop_codon:yes gene_type:complete